MGKVKWDAKSDFEFIQNYKLLQRVFEKRRIDKVPCAPRRSAWQRSRAACVTTTVSVGAVQYIDVEKLVRAKYQDNLEFMQWTKSFYDKNYTGAPYDAAARRASGKGASLCVPVAVCRGRCLCLCFCF